MKNYYQVLGINRKSTKQEIKTAYRKLAHEWHPDKNKSKEAQSKFIEIHEAYEFLTDPEKRKLFDEMYNAETSVATRTQTAEQKSRREEQKTKYEQFEKEAKFKAEYFSKVSFDKLATDILSGIGKVQTGCAYVFGFGFGLFLLGTGLYGFIQMFIAVGKNLEWWRYPLGFIVTSLVMYAGFKILKGLLSETST